MNQMILSIIQIALSVWEMVIFYQLLYETVLKKSEVGRAGRIIGWGNILVVGGLFGVNRLVGFFSIYMFWIGIIITFLCVVVIKKKHLFCVTGIVLLYFITTALVDFFFFLIVVEFLREQFVYTIYIYSMTWWKEIIFFVLVSYFMQLLKLYSRRWSICIVLSDNVNMSYL